MAHTTEALTRTGGDHVMGSLAEREAAGAEVSRSPVQNLHDPSVTFEEYLHYASISRADTRWNSTDADADVKPLKTKLLTPFKRQGVQGGDSIGSRDSDTSPNEKKNETGIVTVNLTPTPGTLVIADEEYVQASRAVRTASWGAVFYLITTDILGPYSTGWAFKQMGYGPGAALFTVFGACAGYGGFLLWKMFLQLDSDRYPLRNYGDVAFRLYGSVARHTVNVMQSIQLVFNVGIIIVTNGQSLAQISKNGACFIVLCLVWALAGMIFGQIRTLARLGWLANAAVWMNVFVIIFTMALVANTEPNYAAALANNMVERGPIVKTAGPPEGVAFDGQIVGLMQAVYSYGGATLFIEFMSEMREPFTFWKGMLLAQLFIYFVYLFFGLFVYSFQGQFTINPAYQGISNYTWQTVGDSFGLVTGLIAAILYGNIGIKVIYNNVLIDLFKFSGLETKAGKLVWIALVPIYWGTSFVIAAAIPQVSNLSGLIAAACILQFSYTFPAIFMLGFQVKKDALQSGEGFDPATGRTTRRDSGFTRWKRGFSKRLAFNTWNLVFFGGSVATAALGIYSAAKGIDDAYKAGSPPSFSCRNPIGA